MRGVWLTWETSLFVPWRDTMISPQRHRDHRENPFLTAGDGPVAPPCPLCLGGDNSCKTNPIRPGRRQKAQNELNFAPPAGAGRERLCKTNPIWPGHGRLTEGIVRNEAKLGGTGVCRQRRLPSVARPGSETCKTNPIWEPEAHDCGLVIADCGLKEAGCGRTPEAECAKRTQFGRARG
jgi:hypothetical protein